MLNEVKHLVMNRGGMPPRGVTEPLFRCLRLPAALLLTLSMLLAAFPSPPGAYAAPAGSRLPSLASGRFTPIRCPFPVPKGLRVECGAFSVPENRHRSSSRSISLAVAIVRTRSRTPAPDPLVYLSGGPGSPALVDTVRFARAWVAFVPNRDLIFVDQRGTGFSKPRLNCPEVVQHQRATLGQALSSAQRLDAEAAALLRCRERLAGEGVDLGAYTSAASAADLNELRLALGYRQWNLFGISYGTRLALTVLRDYPEGVRSVILDSPYPPQVNLFTEMPANIDRAIRMLLDGCAASPACRQAYPDLERTLDELIADLNANPVTVQVRDPGTGTLIPLRVDGNRLIGLLFRMLYTTSIIPSLPRLISDTRVGNYDLLRRLESQRMARALGISHAMYYSIECSEEMPFATLEQAQATVADFPRLSNYFAGVMELTERGYALCKAWGVAKPDSHENEPVTSTVPTLLLSGAYDPITPPAWRLRAAEGLTTSFGYTFPATGHAVVGRGACPAGIMRAFLDRPTVAPDTSCIARIGEPAFVLR